MRIQNTAIVGMGALGMMYGEHIRQAMGKNSVSFVMDPDRYQKNKDAVFKVNGVLQDFNLVDCSLANPADLVIVATKYSGLYPALDVMENLVGEHTIIMSVLNGISSEQIIAERYGDRNLIYCVAIGMDAMRENNDLHYVNKGRLQIGVLKEKQGPALQEVKQFFDKIGLPYTEELDIQHALWGKFLLNVGINQTCMVYDTTYEGALQTPEIFSKMSGAMREVVAVAQKEGVNLTSEDYDNYINILYTLKPDGYPSMRQDALAKRKSEVELFAGTVIKLAARHHVPVPVNKFYYQMIQEIEAAY